MTQLSLITDREPIQLPPEFMQWQSEVRMRLFAHMGSPETSDIRWQPAHLPVVATMGPGNFPINLARKGLGPLPRSDILRTTTERFRQVTGQGSSGDMRKKVELARDFYGDPSNFDPVVLGGLEIFEGRTQQNIEERSPVSILFTGESPRYQSYQINGYVTIERPGEDRYEFLLAARELFGQQAFHISQVRYPLAYLFHPMEFMDKTPVSRR